MVEELSRRWQKQHQVKIYSAKSLKFKLDWQRMLKGNWGRNFMLDYYHQQIFKFSLKALKQADRFGAEIIIAMNGGWQSFLTRVYCWLKAKKMVISGQAGLGWCDGWNLLMRPDVFVATSERNKRWAKRGYGKGTKVEMIYNGVDLSRFKPKGKKYRLGLERPIVLCVAGRDRYKRVEETIMAVAGLKNVSLVVVGGNEEVKKLGKERLGRRFKQLMVEYKQMPEIYRSADVFSLVSESSEAFGVAYLEALASGLPIVATDDGLRREILGRYGIYVKQVEDVQEYGERIKQALEQKKQRPDRWLVKFDWNRIAGEYIKVFKSL